MHGAHAEFKLSFFNIGSQSSLIIWEVNYRDDTGTLTK